MILPSLQLHLAELISLGHIAAVSTHLPIAHSDKIVFLGFCRSARKDRTAAKESRRNYHLSSPLSIIFYLYYRKDQFMCQSDFFRVFRKIVPGIFVHL